MSTTGLAEAEYLTCLQFLLNKKENGYSFSIKGEAKTYYVTLCAVSADNLAFGGFKESCSAFRMCRKCMAHKAQLYPWYVHAYTQV